MVLIFSNGGHGALLDLMVFRVLLVLLDIVDSHDGLDSPYWSV